MPAHTCRTSDTFYPVQPRADGYALHAVSARKFDAVVFAFGQIQAIAIHLLQRNFLRGTVFDYNLTDDDVFLEKQIIVQFRLNGIRYVGKHDFQTARFIARLRHKFRQLRKFVHGIPDKTQIAVNSPVCRASRKRERGKAAVPEYGVLVRRAFIREKLPFVGRIRAKGIDIFVVPFTVSGGVHLQPVMAMK